jgi:Lon protease-like protein
MKNVAQQHPLPRRAPVMVLPNALLFPNALLPLFIFEPRYRAMLEWSLRHHRMFCIALVRRGRSEWSTPTDLYQVAGLGLIRACVKREDGTSQLILQGLARVEFTEFSDKHPFLMAGIREVPVTAAGDAEAAALSALVLDLCAQHRATGQGIPEALDEQLAQIRDPGLLSDLVAHTLVRDPYRRQSVLEAGNVAARLRTLIHHLREELP